MDFEKYLRDKNIKVTGFRVNLLKILHKTQYPIQAKEIEEQWDTPIDRVTLYRTLKTFAKHNIIHKIEVNDSITGYNFIDPANIYNSNKNHPHFYCNICNKVICLPNCQTNLESLPEGFIQRTTNTIIKGICKTCNTTNK